MKRSLHVTSAVLSVFALCSISFSARAENVVTPSYYVGDSLVAMYDGIYNATNAAGELVHDPSATKWLDLSGNGRDFTVTANGSWSDTTFNFNKTSATLTPALPYYRTQEIRFEMESGRWILFGSAFNGYVYQGLVSVSSFTNKFQTAWTTDNTVTMKWLDASSCTSPFSTTVTYGGLGEGAAACYCNGAATPNYTGKNGWASSGTSIIGNWSEKTGWEGKGRIQSIRLYSRVLTDAEIARNHLVDQVRFEGATPSEALGASVSCAQIADAADAAGALVRWTASSFGWLATSLASVTVECSRTSDFASPIRVPARLAEGATDGDVALSGLVPGASYYVRAVATNNLGAASAGQAAQIVAQTSASATPVVLLDSAYATSCTAAAIGAYLEYVPAGAECDLLAVFSAPGLPTVTNLFASGVSSAGPVAGAITHLQPGTDYTVSVIARSGAVAGQSAALALHTPAQVLPPTIYVQDGLIVQLDGIFNSTNAVGAPVHDPAAAKWTDLTGNLSFDRGGLSAQGIEVGDDCMRFPAAEAYFEATNANVMSDAVLNGTFTVESEFLVGTAPTTEQQCWPVFSLGSGSSTAPRTLCYDVRNGSGNKIGCVQYNASGWPGDGGRVANHANNGVTAPKTFAITGGGAAKSDARFYNSGTFISTIKNYGKYTAANVPTKTLRVRHYSTVHVATTFHALRVYNRVLSDAELAVNLEIDGVRFRGEASPEPIAPAVTVSCVDNSVSGEILASWNIGSCGWKADSLSSITLEYSLSPEFENPTTVTLASDTASSGSLAISGLEPRAIYYARAISVNSLGLASVGEVFTFRASGGVSHTPVFTAGVVAPSVGGAEFDFELISDGGYPCGAFAVLSHDGLVSTNTLFEGRSGAFSGRMALAPLAPASSYTATIIVTNASGEAADPVVRAFATLADNAFVNPYVTRGLIGLFDGILNSTNAVGAPVHESAPAAWRDLMGNFATTMFGSQLYYDNHVEFQSSVDSYMECADAAAACDAILAGAFTVETVFNNPRRTTGGEDGNSGQEQWPVFSFGSGSYVAPRLLCFDTRVHRGLYGAIQYNASKWYDDTAMGHYLDFSHPETWSIVGGGAAGADATLYCNAVATNVVPNQRDYSPGAAMSKAFALHKYSGSISLETFYSFRIYDRSLSDMELAANRVADEVRFFNGTASLSIASAARDGDMLTATLSRSGTTIPADIFVLFSERYGDETEYSTPYSFGAGDATARASVVIPAGAAYVRFKSGGLVTPAFLIADAPAAGAVAVAVGKLATTDVTSTNAVIVAPMTVPAGEGPVALSAAYGLSPDALAFTNALGGASSVAASGLVSGTLSGLAPNRTYYCHVLAVKGGEVVAASAEPVVFTTEPDDNSGAAILGDEVSVTGHETGDTLTFSGTVQGAASVTVNGTAASIAQDGSWTATVTDIAAGVAADYVVRAWSAGGALIDALPAITETTCGASSLHWNLRGAIDQRCVTVTGAIDIDGANDTTIRLLTGPSASALTNTVSTIHSHGGEAPFSFEWHAPTFGETIFWAVEIENAATNQGNGHWVTRSAVSSLDAIDYAIYTWRPVDGDWSGSWSNPEHWVDDKGGDSIGWPSVATAQARIDQGTVNMDVSVSVGYIDFGTNGLVTITGNGTTLRLATIYANDYIYIRDGARVVFSGPFNVMATECTIAACVTNTSAASYSALLIVENGATFSVLSFLLSHDAELRVRDATASLSNGIYLDYGLRGINTTSSFGSIGGLVRLEGTSPLINIGTNLRCINQTNARVGGAVEFCVPRGGYARTPLKMTGTGNGQTLGGDANVAGLAVATLFRIAADSPLYGTSGTVDYELATWRVGHTDDASLVSLVPLRGAAADPKRYLYITPNDRSLRVSFHNGGTIFLVQ